MQQKHAIKIKVSVQTGIFSFWMPPKIFALSMRFFLSLRAKFIFSIQQKTVKAVWRFKREARKIPPTTKEV